MEPTPRIELTIARTIVATPEEVYDAWLDPNAPGGPFFGAERLILKAAVDEVFYHCVRHGGRTWAHYGRFVRLERPRRIEYTWVSEWTRGFESTVTIVLEPQGDATVLTLRHKDVPDDEVGRGHEAGWNFVVDAVAERFARRER